MSCILAIVELSVTLSIRRWIGQTLLLLIIAEGESGRVILVAGGQRQ